MDKDIRGRDLSRDGQIDQQGRSTRSEIYQSYQSMSIVSPWLFPSKRRKQHHFKRKQCAWKKPIIIACTAFLLMVLLGCGALSASYYYYVTNIKPSLTSFERPVSRDHHESALNLPPVDFSLITGRSWNILLLGSDDDGKFAFPQVLTQVMMVVHIDTVNNMVSMVSIPRDSWVAVPEVGGMHKIDQAFLLGAQRDNNFESGIRLARLTVEQDYGIPIDRYAWVGLDGFAKVIDTLGGVDVDITHPVVDDIYPNDSGTRGNPNNPYTYTRLYLAPGPQHLMGEQALEYVRTRHSDQIGDIGRTERQQQVLTALKPKLTSPNMLANVAQLLKSLEKKFYTDLSEQEMLAMAEYGRMLSSNTVQHVTLGPGQGQQDYGNLATIYDPMLGADQDVVLPHCENIQPVINHIFGLGDAQSCHILGSS